MTPSGHAPDAPPSASPGRLSRALIRVLMKHAYVVEARSIADGFRLVTLESPEFKGLHWSPGQKLQIAMGSAFVARTFTPIEWDAAAGRTRLLGYMHGLGPGSAWIRDVVPGDACDVFGPRASLDSGDAADMCVVFGDETSIGLASAIKHHAPGRNLRCLFEVGIEFHARQALKYLGLEAAELFERTEADSHLERIECRLQPLAATGASFVLTGKASSIQRLRRHLKSLGIPASRLLSKPYWAPGKTGLD